MKKTISILLVFSLMAVMALLLSSCECEHEWETVPGVEATCAKSGYTEYQRCTICGKEEGYIFLSQTDLHSYVETVEKAPTCDTWNGNGDKRLTCSVCRYSYIEYGSIPALTEHTSSGAPTCTTWEICTVCDSTINYGLGHSYEGTTDGTCIRCDAGVKFILPTTPKNISCTSGYDKTCKIESIKIERKQKYSVSTPTYELTFMVQSTYHEKGNNYSDDACFGWKLYDEDGVVVCSGTEYTQGSIMVGEKSKVVKAFYEGGGYSTSLETGKTYHLELNNIG